MELIYVRGAFLFLKSCQHSYPNVIDIIDHQRFQLIYAVFVRLTFILLRGDRIVTCYPTVVLQPGCQPSEDTSARVLTVHSWTQRAFCTARRLLPIPNTRCIDLKRARPGYCRRGCGPECRSDGRRSEGRNKESYESTTSSSSIFQSR